MKLAVAAATLIAMTHARPAAACEPAYTCGDEYCRGSVAVVEGTVESIHAADSSGDAYADVQLAAVYGDTGGLAAGTRARLLLGPYSPFFDGDIGSSLVLGLIRDDQGFLQVDTRTDLTDSSVTKCFGTGATSATVADAVLSPSCYATLVPNPEPNPSCPDGAIHCDAGGAHGSLWVVGAVGLVLRRRARRQARSRRTGR